MQKILTPTNYELIPLDDKTNVRFYTSYDSGSYVPPHWHDAVEILYLQEGELKVIVENTCFQIKEGQCILINGNRVHSTLCTKPNRAIVFQIPESFIKKFITDSQLIEFTIKDPADTAVMQGKIELFKDTLAKMQYIMDYKPDGGILRFNSQLFEILYQLYHNFRTPVTASDLTRHNKQLEKLEPVLLYITDHYNMPITLEEISSVAMFESKYFCRFFKKCMGATFLEYQNEIRLSKIYNDLITTEDKITDILERHGFTNYKLFRKTFQVHFNAKPSEIRRSAASEIRKSTASDTR